MAASFAFTNYFVNFRTTDGMNPEFVQVDKSTFDDLANGRKVIGTTRGVAIYHGRTTDAENDMECLQFLDVPLVALLPIDPSAENVIFKSVDLRLSQPETPAQPSEPVTQPVTRYTFDDLDIAIENGWKEIDAKGDRNARLTITLTASQWHDLRSDPNTFRYIDARPVPKPCFEYRGAIVHYPA